MDYKSISTKLIPILLFFFCGNLKAQQKVFEPVKLVNVFLGSSGDHGQLSPAASSPFGMMSIGPQTYPNLHAGYEHNAKLFLGFTHNRFEGVGCTGSGGLLLIKPFLGDEKDELIKTVEDASPGYYHVGFENKIDVKLTAGNKSGIHKYLFPKGKKGVYIDFSHALSRGFVAEEHTVNNKGIEGWIEARTTCSEGKYKVYYQIYFGKKITVKSINEHKLNVFFDENETEEEIRIGFSAVNHDYAVINANNLWFDRLKQKSQNEWNEKLSTIKAEGDITSQKLFYSLLYRTMQSPYLISEADGSYKTSNGTTNQSKEAYYNGWAVWDNYRTQLPLLSIIQPKAFQDMTSSIASLYLSGKKDYATQKEPSNTVRTEHAIVVLLDAYRKGYKVDFAKIADSLVSEINRLDFSKPDKALEASYDVWALAQIFNHLKQPELYKKYLEKAADYKKYWNKDFKDIDKNDVDRMQARGLYQGTIWQYRWFVPFDVKGLIELCGGDENYLAQLTKFYKGDFYNHANEPDLQVPLMFNMTKQPWVSQKWMHQLAADTVVQYYFNDNSRGIDPFVDRIYKNEPKAYIRTMDDDAGAMSAWYVFTASGFSPACVGLPIYYLNVPLFKTLTYNLPAGKQFIITVNDFTKDNIYINQVKLNGKLIDRNWISQDEIMAGGVLEINASKTPNHKFGTVNQWISSMDK
ncbi:glycoside hydrolase domain-containing protein [Pedobacter frigiditerrae]|nr:glycoside hydrolase domain-containing protein [Pedobacter frigiditerrae]